MIAAIVTLGCTWDFHMKQDTPSLPMWRMWEHIFLWRITSDDDIVWIEVPNINPPRVRRFAFVAALLGTLSARFALGVALRGFTNTNYYYNRFVSRNFIWTDIWRKNIRRICNFTDQDCFLTWTTSFLTLSVCVGKCRKSPQVICYLFLSRLCAWLPCC